MGFRKVFAGIAGLLSLAVVLSLVAAVVTLAQPAFVGRFISSAGQDAALASLGVLVGLLVLSSALSAVQTYVVSVAADKAVFQIRRSLINQVISLPMVEHDRRNSGSFVTRLTSDTSIVSTAVSTGLVESVGGVAVIAGAVVYMAIVDLWLFAIVMGILFVMTVVVVSASAKIESLSEQVQDHLATFGSVLQNGLGAIRTVKSLGAESVLKSNLTASAYDAYRARKKMSLTESVLAPVSELATYLSLVVVMVVGTLRVTSGSLSAESLAVFLTLLFLTILPLTQVASAVAAFREAKGALGRIDELLSLPTEGSDALVEPLPSDLSLDDRPSGSLAFDKVCYSYGSQQVLKEVSFEVNPGEKVAITGPSGTGKTTLFSLALGFYAVEAGDILVAGRSISQWSFVELRRFIAYVEQEPELLPGTLKENLVLGLDQPPNQSEILTVLEKVGLGSYANPNRLQFQIGDRNVGLSGGEKQRIAIARALLRRSPIILVDEPTSALDRDSGTQAISALLDSPATVLLVTHDPHVSDRADRTVYLNQNTQIAPENNKEDLVNEK